MLHRGHTEARRDGVRGSSRFRILQNLKFSLLSNKARIYWSETSGSISLQGFLAHKESSTPAGPP